MLNPKLIDVFREGSRDMLNKLALEIGEKLATKCYFTTDSSKRICGGRYAWCYVYNK